MDIIVWIIFGGLAGWIASKLMGTDAQQGVIANVVVGVIGAFLGGYLMQLLGGPVVDGFNVKSFIVAVLGAVVLLFVYKTVRGRS